MTPGTDRAISAVPSVEPLSTTIISSSSDGRLCARIASRQRPIVARQFQTAMITIIKGLCIGVIFDVQANHFFVVKQGFRVSHLDGQAFEAGGRKERKADV